MHLPATVFYFVLAPDIQLLRPARVSSVSILSPELAHFLDEPLL